jgi:pimeloyl-ACP methyl ester carboxylesterase
VGRNEKKFPNEKEKIKMQKTKMYALTTLLTLTLMVTIVPLTVPIATAADEWALVNDARAMKAYPDLKEYVWQKNASAPPQTAYNRIGLHRLLKTGTTIKGVVFMIPNFANGGEEYTSNPPTDSWTKTENYSQAIYWANKGFDVYAMDLRTHFVPNTLNVSQLSFMKDWGWDMYVSDVKEAVNKAKEVSGAQKVFLVSYSQGAGIAMNFAAKHWKEDLQGMIFEGPIVMGVAFYIGKRGNETNTYNYTAQVNNMTATEKWATENAQLSNILMMKYALENPGAPAEYPPGTPLTPTVNPLTNKTWANITERNTYFWSTVSPLTNTLGGYGNITQIEYTFSVMDRWIPARLDIESKAMIDWVNCPYVTYDYDDHYAEIGVPVLAYSGLYTSNRTGTFRGFINRIKTTDFTSVGVQNYGQYDTFLGTYSARDVSQPALDWMRGQLVRLKASAFCNVTLIGGGTWYFFAHSNGGTGPHTYQWYEGTTLLQGQTSIVLPITKTSLGIYTFYCKVTDSEGATTNSNTVTLTVLS